MPQQSFRKLITPDTSEIFASSDFLLILMCQSRKRREFVRGHGKVPVTVISYELTPLMPFKKVITDVLSTCKLTSMHSIFGATFEAYVALGAIVNLSGLVCQESRR